MSDQTPSPQVPSSREPSSPAPGPQAADAQPTEPQPSGTQAPTAQAAPPGSSLPPAASTASVPPPGDSLPPAYPAPASYPPSAPASYPPPAPAKPAGFGNGLGKGLGLGIGLGAALTIGSVVTAMVFGVLVGSALGGATTTTTNLEVAWGSPAASNTIHAVNVTGAIMASPSDGTTLTGGTYGYEVAAEIDALETEDAAGLLLVMNTPGGSITGSKAIADAVARYQQRTDQKVVAYVQGISASGGMYAMAGADEIIADHGSMIGSIGVIFGPIERYRDVTAITGNILTSGVETTGGITQEYITRGEAKDAGDPFRDLTESEREMFDTMIDNFYGDFVEWVAHARSLKPEFIRDTLGARVFDPQTAIGHGLIDAELGLEEGYRKAAEVMGVDPDDTQVVQLAPPTLIDQLLGAEARVPGQALPATVSPGQRLTSGICAPTAAVLAFYGQPSALCG